MRRTTAAWSGTNGAVSRMADGAAMATGGAAERAGRTGMAAAAGDWLIVYTAPQAERAVQAELDAVFETYAPLCVHWAFVTVRRRRVAVRRPLFPRYLFIRETADSAADGRSIRRIVRRAEGAIDLLAALDVPLRARHTAIVGLMRAERAGLFDETRAEPRSCFRPGVPVVLTGSLWSGVAGVVAGAPRKGAVRVEVTEFGRPRLLDVPLDILRLVGAEDRMAMRRG